MIARTLYLRPLAVVALLLAALPLFAAAPARAEPARAEMALIMVQEAGCSWCRLWHEEIGPIYPKTAEASKAPLRLVDLHDDWPSDLPEVTPVHFTPTFILLKDGEEVGRILGYPGEDFFWGLLAEMIEKQSGGKEAPATY